MEQMLACSRLLIDQHMSTDVIRSCTDSKNRSEVEAEILLQCHMWSHGNLALPHGVIWIV